MDCYNHSCWFRANKTSNPNRCEYVACKNRSSSDFIITSSRTLTDYELAMLTDWILKEDDMNNNETSKELRTVNGGALVNAAPKDTLTELMDIAAARAGEVLQMAYRINLHLFGMGEPEPDDKTMPTCFRDVLCAEMALLDKTAEELAKLIEKLGC